MRGAVIIIISGMKCRILPASTLSPGALQRAVAERYEG